MLMHFLIKIIFTVFIWAKTHQTVRDRQMNKNRIRFRSPVKKMDNLELLPSFQSKNPEKTVASRGQKKTEEQLFERTESPFKAYIQKRNKDIYKRIQKNGNNTADCFVNFQEDYQKNTQKKKECNSPKLKLKQNRNHTSFVSRINRDILILKGQPFVSFPKRVTKSESKLRGGRQKISKIFQDRFFNQKGSNQICRNSFRSSLNKVRPWSPVQNDSMLGEANALVSYRTEILF